MWISENHPNPPRPSSPPAETGRRLATFDRGQGVEMRITLAEYQGHPYVSLRLWECDQAGQWFPVKGKGCSVRISEARTLARELAAAADSVDAGRRDDGTTAKGPERRTEAHRGPEPRYVERGRRDRAPWEPEKLPKPDGQAGFNEFTGDEHG